MSLPMPPSGPKSFQDYVTESLTWVFGTLIQLSAGQQALAQKLENLQMSMDDVAGEVATLKSNVANLATEIHSEIADLADAIAKNDPAKIQAVLDDLRATNAQLEGLGGELAADNAPAQP